MLNIFPYPVSFCGEACVIYAEGTTYQESSDLEKYINSFSCCLVFSNSAVRHYAGRGREWKEGYKLLII